MQQFEEREPVIIENQGQKIFGVIHKPLLANRKSAILMCHGFAGNKIGRYRIYVQMAQQLARAGIASLRIDFRGSGESEGDFSEMTIDGEVSDALKGIEWLRKQSGIDSERIGILGNSFGGAIAVLAAQKDGHLKSIALLAPLFNSEQWRKKWELLMTNAHDESAKKEMTRILEGNTPGAGFYPGFFALNLESQLKDLQRTPLLHIHSEKDERVGFDQAEHYKRCREKAQSNTKWLTLQNCDHDFSNMQERHLIIEEIVKWFQTTL